MSIAVHRCASLVFILLAVFRSGHAQVKPGDAITMKVTAYCPCKICCGKWAASAKTATGDDARITDGVAADPKLLPYRTRLEIPGAGVREVDDTGGAMRQSAKKGVYHIDLRMATHAEARQWGVRYLKVKILETPKPRQKQKK